MSFMVDGGMRKRPRFNTLEEACAIANEAARTTGIILGVFDDKRPANAEYREEK